MTGRDCTPTPASAGVRTARAATGIASIELVRPDRGNALSAATVRALLEAVDMAVADPATHTLVLRAEGRHFCTGFDLSGLEAETDASLLARVVDVELLLDRLWRAPLRTLAIGQGRIMGAGADLFVACDERWLHECATLRFPGAAFGLVLGTRRLAARVGDAAALRWVGGGDTIDAQAALASGLATRLLEASDAAADPLSLLAEPAVDRVTAAALKAAVRDRDADSDLAALVRSAARPGLHERIRAYRDRQLAARPAAS